MRKSNQKVNHMITHKKDGTPLIKVMISHTSRAAARQSGKSSRHWTAQSPPLSVLHESTHARKKFNTQTIRGGPPRQWTNTSSPPPKTTTTTGQTHEQDHAPTVAIHFADGYCHKLVNCQIEMYMYCGNAIPNCMHGDVVHTTIPAEKHHTTQHRHKPFNQSDDLGCNKRQPDLGKPTRHYLAQPPTFASDAQCLQFTNERGDALIAHMVKNAFLPAQHQQSNMTLNGCLPEKLCSTREVNLGVPK